MLYMEHFADKPTATLQAHIVLWASLHQIYIQSLLVEKLEQR